MVLIKIGLVAAAIAAVLVLAREQMWFERAGLLADCQQVAAPAGARLGGQWWSCKEGALSGLPNLAADNCVSKGIRGNTELWHCPLAIERPTFG